MGEQGALFCSEGGEEEAEESEGEGEAEGEEGGGGGDGTAAGGGGGGELWWCVLRSTEELAAALEGGSARSMLHTQQATYAF